jgi:hypothetical protein
LKQIGDDRGPALTVEKDDFRREAVAPDDRMVDLSCPHRNGAIAKIDVKTEIGPLFTQTGWRINGSVGILALPVAEECVMERIGSDEMANPTEFPQLGAKIVG